MLIATNNQLYHLPDKNPSQIPALWLETDFIQAIAVSGNWAAAALSKGNILTWQGEVEQELIETGVEEEISSLLILNTNPLVLLFGTEPPHIYRWPDPTGKPVKMKAFEQLECRKKWFTPWGGPPAVRSLACSKKNWVYADIHVGSIMRSSDGGENWEPVTPSLNQDVHQVNTTPIAPDRVYANTADAVWISHDRGNSWQHRPFPHDATYGRAIDIHPFQPDCLLASVSQGPHEENDVQGRLFRTDNEGQTWTHVTAGFPAYTKNNINTHCLAFDQQGTAWGAVENNLYCSLDQGKTWSLTWRSPNNIRLLSGFARHDHELPSEG